MLLLVRLCAITLCLAAFKFALHYESISLDREATFVLSLLACTVFSSILFMTTWWKWPSSSNARGGGGGPSLVDSLSLLLIGASLSPVLGTLTSSYASNTVSQMTALAYLMHLIASDNRLDYDLFHTNHPAWASPISFNSAFAGILLQASRFQNSALSFAFTVFCTSVLVFLPRGCSHENVSGVFALLCCCAEYFTWMWLGGLRQALGLSCALTFVGYVAPHIMFARIKADKLQGPWDLLRLEEVQEGGDE